MFMCVYLCVYLFYSFICLFVYLFLFFHLFIRLLVFTCFKSHPAHLAVVVNARRRHRSQSEDLITSTCMEAQAGLCPGYVSGAPSKAKCPRLPAHIICMARGPYYGPKAHMAKRCTGPYVPRLSYT